MGQSRLVASSLLDTDQRTTYGLGTHVGQFQRRTNVEHHDFFVPRRDKKGIVLSTERPRHSPARAQLMNP